MRDVSFAENVPNSRIVTLFPAATSSTIILLNA